MSLPKLMGLTFRMSPHGIQAKRKNGEVTLVYKELRTSDNPQIGPNEMWLVEASAAPQMVQAEGKFQIIPVLPVLPLRHTAGETVVLDLVYQNDQWRSRQQSVIGEVTTLYILDNQSEFKPVHPGEAGRYVCRVTKLISVRPNINGERCSVIVAVAIVSRVVSARGARRANCDQMSIPVAPVA